MILYEWKEGQPDRDPKTQEERSAFSFSSHSIRGLDDICKCDSKGQGSELHWLCTREPGHEGLHIAGGIGGIYCIWNEEIKPKDSPA